MFKHIAMAISAALLLGPVQAMAAVVGGGTNAPQTLYGYPSTPLHPAPIGILNGPLPQPGFNNYIGVGSDAGKTAFLTNDSSRLVWDLDDDGDLEPAYTPAVTVDYAGSDAILTPVQLVTYQSMHQSPNVPATDSAKWGPLLQIPTAAMSITIPYKLTLANGSAVSNLNLTGAQLCAIFSGTVSTWNQVNASFPATPIKVIYRGNGSGTTEIFTRYLSNQCPTKFVTNTVFPTANLGPEPSNWLAQRSEQYLAEAVSATEGAIGYVGPSVVNASNNAVVARVDGHMPIIGAVVTPLSIIAPPTGSVGVPAEDRSNPINWAKVLGNPTNGYPIIGYTYLVFSQCYKDATDTVAVRNFIDRHYNLSPVSNNDDEVVAVRLIPLTSAWKTAIRNTFWISASALSVGKTTVCNGIGRPL